MNTTRLREKIVPKVKPTVRKKTDRLNLEKIPVKSELLEQKYDWWELIG